MLAQPDAPRRLAERVGLAPRVRRRRRPPPTNPVELAVRCGCSRAACGHPRGCAGVTQPNVAIGESDMALSAPRRDAAHAPAAKSSTEVAREARLRQVPPRHAHCRRGRGRPHAVRAALGGRGGRGGSDGCAARRTAEVGGAPDERRPALRGAATGGLQRHCRRRIRARPPRVRLDQRILLASGGRRCRREPTCLGRSHAPGARGGE